MRIKKGDKVIVITGGDKGKEGIVQAVFPKTHKVVVEGVNVHKKTPQADPEDTGGFHR